MKSDKVTRKDAVLFNIVQSYVDSAQPVSSKYIANRMGNSISSATIRNVMAKLEAEGYIEQPHTSAGRVPTDVGYRMYVNLMKAKLRIEKAKAERLAEEFEHKMYTLKDVIKKTSNLISTELNNAGIVMLPEIGTSYLKQLKLVRIHAEKIVAVLVTMTNSIKNYVIDIEKDINKMDLERISNFINDNYQEEGLSNICRSLKSMITSEQDGYILDSAKAALKIVDNMLLFDAEDDIYLEGLECLADECKDNKMQIKSVFKILSNRKEILSLMRQELPYNGIKAYIGEENDMEGFKDLSIITSGYGIKGITVGRIGVIGPRRMNYEKNLKMLSMLSAIISAKFNGMS